MKKSLLALSFALFGLLAQAQFGVTAAYAIPQVRFDSDSRTTESVWQGNLEYSVNYWFRLSQKRIEFLPSLSYASFDYNTDYVGNVPSGDFNLLNLGFQLHTRIYPFDFDTDCDCPTFGKQGPALDKGLFIQLSPGVSYFRDSKLNLDDGGGPLVFRESGVLPTLGLALGLDFGVSNLVTISPIAGARYAFGDLPEADAAVYAPRNGDFWTISAGIQLGVRLDEKRY
ncbi:MAG: hypothetical protein AAGF87_07445 [Bacteroidota bacterium]